MFLYAWNTKQPLTELLYQSGDGNKLLSVSDMSEIPRPDQQPGTGRSKGANLFLARQKLIADMMEAEAEAEKAAEGDLCDLLRFPVCLHREFRF